MEYSFLEATLLFSIKTRIGYTRKVYSKHRIELIETTIKTEIH